MLLLDALPLSYNSHQTAEEIQTLVIQGNMLRMPSRYYAHASSSILGFGYVYTITWLPLPRDRIGS